MSTEVNVNLENVNIDLGLTSIELQRLDELLKKCKNERKTNPHLDTLLSVSTMTRDSIFITIAQLHTETKNLKALNDTIQTPLMLNTSL